MTIFIKIPKDKLEAFSNEYFTVTGEHVQLSPPISEDGTCYVIGTSRMTEVQKTELEISQSEILTDTMPFATKDD